MKSKTFITVLSNLHALTTGIIKFKVDQKSYFIEITMIFYMALLQTELKIVEEISLTQQTVVARNT